MVYITLSPQGHILGFQCPHSCVITITNKGAASVILMYALAKIVKTAV